MPLGYRAAPAVQAAGATVTATTGTSAGDLICIFAVDVGDASKTLAISGFTNQASSPTSNTTAILTRVADGTEGSTFAVTGYGTAANVRSVIVTVTGGAVVGAASAYSGAAAVTSIPLPSIAVTATSWVLWFCRTATGNPVAPTGMTTVSSFSNTSYGVFDDESWSAGTTGIETGTCTSSVAQGAMLAFAPGTVNATVTTGQVPAAGVSVGMPQVSTMPVTATLLTTTAAFPAPTVEQDQTVAVSTVTASAAFPAPSAGGILVTNSAEGGASGVAVTTANSGGTSGNAFTAVSIGTGATFAPDSTRAAHGLLSYKLATVASAAVYTQWAAPAAMPPQVWFRFNAYFTANPAANTRILTMLQGGTRCGFVQITTLGKLVWIDETGGNGMCSTVAAVPLNAWFRAEGYLVGSAAAGRAELQLFPVTDGILPSEIDTSANGMLTTGPPNLFDVGTSAALASMGPYWLDDLELSTSGYIGPVAPVMNPAVVAAAAGIPQVSLGGPAAPAVLASASSVPVPAVNVIYPATVTAASSVPYPVVSSTTAAATATAAAVTCSTAFAVPTVITGGVNITTGQVAAATTAFPAAAAGAGCTATPATVTATGSFPVPAVNMIYPAAVTATATVRFAWIPAGRVGAFWNGSGVGQFAPMNAIWQGWTGTSIQAARYYNGLSDFTYYSDMATMAAAGVKICLTLRPAYNPVSATDLANMSVLLGKLWAAGAIVDVCLWHEPYFEGLSSAQYIAMVQYYAAAVRAYYPLVFVTNVSSVTSHSENTYYPGDAYVDKVATDIYSYNYTTQGDRLDNSALPANNAQPPKPFGVWEFNGSTDPAHGQTQTQVTTLYTYIQTYMAARLAAGLQNCDVLLFDCNQPDWLGLASSQNAAFTGGIGNWAAYPSTGNCAVAYSSAVAHSPGTGSMAMTTSAAGAMTAYCALGGTGGQPVVAGTSSVTAQAWFKAATTTETCQVNIVWYTSAGTYLSTSSGTAVSDSTSVWTQVTTTVTAPATAAYALPQVQVNGAAASGELHNVADVDLFISAASPNQSTVINFGWDYRIAAWQSLYTALNAQSPAGTNTYAYPAVAAVTSTVPQPVVTAGANANVTTAVVEAATTAFPGPGVAGSATVTASTVTATATVPAPAVSGAALATPAVVTGSVTAPVPVVEQDQTVTVLVLALVAALPPPGVSGSLTATVLTSSTTVPAPAASGSAAAAPAVAACSTAWPAAVVSPGPAAVTSSTTFPAPIVRQDATPAPATVTRTATWPAVTVTPGPAVLAAGTAIPAPVVRQDQNVTPATVTATTALPACAVATSGNITVLPAVVAAAVTLPAPVVRQDATVAAAAITSGAALPAATVTGAATASPAVVSASSAVPVAAVSPGPVTVAALAAFPVPAAAGSAACSPASVTVTAVFPAPAASGGALAAPSAVTSTGTYPAPVAACASSASPAALTVTTTVPVPAVATAAGVTVTGVAVLAAAVFPGPLVEQDATVTAGPATASTALPGPAAAGAAAASLAAVPGIAVFPACTVTGGGPLTPAPATLAATASFPAPVVRRVVSLDVDWSTGRAALTWATGPASTGWATGPAVAL